MVSAPYQKRIIEDAAILVDNTVNFRLYKGGCTNNHVVFKCNVPACCCGLLGDSQVVGIELLQVVRVGNIASADASLAIVHNDVDGKLVKLEQLALLNQ